MDPHSSLSVTSREETRERELDEKPNRLNGGKFFLVKKLAGLASSTHGGLFGNFFPPEEALALIMPMGFVKGKNFTER